MVTIQNKGKRKGKSFEDTIQKLIIKKFNSNERYIKRQGQSGVRNDELGDIEILDKNVENIFPFIIECKKQERIKMKNIFGYSRFNKSNPLYSYIQQVKKDVEKYNEQHPKNKKHGMVVFSKNYEDYYQLIYNDTLEDLERYVEFFYLHEIEHYKTKIYNDTYIQVFSFEEYLDKIKEIQKL